VLCYITAVRTRTEAEQYIREETNGRGRVSQRGRILRLLLSANEIGLPAILDLRIGQYCARIAELRECGFHIENRTARNGDVRQSWYSLVCAAPVPVNLSLFESERHV
jgi:hypothetical protein